MKNWNVQRSESGSLEVSKSNNFLRVAGEALYGKIVPNADALFALAIDSQKSDHKIEKTLGWDFSVILWISPNRGIGFENLEDAQTALSWM